VDLTADIRQSSRVSHFDQRLHLGPSQRNAASLRKGAIKKKR
jgi:hypothetical protein